jgi:hypothetical protein
VQHVVAGVELHHVGHALLAPLRVHADALHVGRRRVPQQPEVAGAQHPELADGFPGVGIGVAEPVGPGVLVEARDRRTVVRQRHAHPPAPHDLAVGEMAQHVVDRPLSRRLAPAELVGRETARELPKPRLGPGQDVERVGTGDEAEHRGGVVVGLFFRSRGSVGEY